VSERDLLLLRFDAPLMSFGGVQVDENNTTEAFPSLSMLTGLLGNALGYHHRDAERLERLQQRLCYAVRCDRRGAPLMDYQTVDLGQDFLREAWTTWGAPGRRAGGSAKTGTHIRYRHYRADAVYTLALSLDPADEEPTLEACAQALREPERPLFLGRKACLPAAPLLLGQTRASGLRAALTEVPLSDRVASDDTPFSAWWPEEGEPAPAAGKGRRLPVSDFRDWSNQVHTGRRFLWHGQILREELAHGG